MIDSQRLESIVSEAGRIAYDLWPGAGNALDAWEKKPGDPVCEADLAVDAFLKRELGRGRAQPGIHRLDDGEQSLPGLVIHLGVAASGAHPTQRRIAAHAPLEKDVFVADLSRGLQYITDFSADSNGVLAGRRVQPLNVAALCPCAQ